MDYTQYFAHRYRKADPTTFVCMASLHNVRDADSDTKGKFDPDFFKAHDAEGMAQFAAEHGGVHNVYASANTFDKRKRRKDDLAQILRLHVDIDHAGMWAEGKPKVDEISARIGDFTQKVDTGGGVQIEWDLPEPLPATPENVALVDDYQQQLVEKYGGDTGAKALNHVLRVPGTKNFPDSKKAVTKERGWDPLDVSEPSLQDRTFTPEWLGLKCSNEAVVPYTAPQDNGAALPEPQVITREETEQGITRETCSLKLASRTWDLIEAGPDAGADASEQGWRAINELLMAGADDKLIKAIMRHPTHKIGDNRRKRKDGQLDKEIKKARAQNPLVGAPEADERTAALLFLQRYGNTIRAIPNNPRNARWAVFNEKLTRWVTRESVQDQIMPIADDFEHWAMVYWEEAAKRGDNARYLAKKAERYMKFANGLRCAAGSKAVESFLIRSVLAGITLEPTDFDADPDLIGVKNGVLSLSKRCLVQAEPDDLVLRSLGCDFTTDVVLEGSFFETFVKGLGTVADDLQQMCGYCLEPKNGKQMVGMILGPRGTSKSTLASCVRRTMGDYAMATTMAIFRNPIANQATPSLARMVGKRVAFLQEVEGGKLDNASLKRMCGGDSVPCRFLHGDEFELNPSDTKILLMGNDEPDVEAIDGAIRDRLIILNMDDINHRGEGRIEDLDQKIEPELMLLWLLDGMQRVRDHGFQWSDAAKGATKGYFKSQNLYTQFREEILTEGHESETDRVAGVEMLTVYQAFEVFSEAVDKRKAVPSYKQWCAHFRKECPDLLIAPNGHDKRLCIKDVYVDHDRVKHFKNNPKQYHQHEHAHYNKDESDDLF